uniref:Ig-like domain-containing protein n=1 Tax=Leptobrachium leishanense TaxID=445787 RepID=A0A8C5LKL8_9ANUR
CGYLPQAFLILFVLLSQSPTNLEVIIATSGDSAEMQCSYGQQQRWSKIWCKLVGNTCDWVVHSDGKINSDYRQRPVIYNNPNYRIWKMELTSLELWDSGLYLCQESGGQTVLNKVLLLVIPEEDNNPGKYSNRLKKLMHEVEEGNRDKKFQKAGFVHRVMQAHTHCALLCVLLLWSSYILSKTVSFIAVVLTNARGLSTQCHRCKNHQKKPQLTALQYRFFLQQRHLVDNPHRVTTIVVVHLKEHSIKKYGSLL